MKYFLGIILTTIPLLDKITKGKKDPLMNPSRTGGKKKP